MDKTKLRKSAISSLNELDPKQKQWIEMSLFRQLIALDSWKRSMMIGVTVSQGIEWDTKQIMETAWNQDKKICVPKCYRSNNQLIFYQLDTYEQLEHAYANLLEPNPVKTIPVPKTQIDLLLVPGLLFNKQGYRIGFGGGYYDRFLQDFTNQTISLTSEDQIVGNLPVEPYDIPVQQILTENGPIMEEW